MKRLLIAVFFAGLALAGKAQYKPLETGIALKLVPQISETGKRSVFLKYETNDVYECSNYVLGFEYYPSIDKIHIVIQGMAEPKVCDDKLGPATCLIDITNLQPGVYKYTTIANRQFFKGTLTVDPKFIHLALDEKTDRDLLRITNPRLNLIPDKAVWGKIEYTDPAMKEVAVQLLEDMKKEGASVLPLETGNYGDFYLHQKGITEEKAVTSVRFEYPFVFGYDGDVQRLTLLMDMYAQRYASKMKISLVHSSGKRAAAGTCP